MWVLSWSPSRSIPTENHGWEGNFCWIAVKALKSWRVLCLSKSNVIHPDRYSKSRSQWYYGKSISKLQMGGRAIDQAVVAGFPPRRPGFAPGSGKWDLWWKKWRRGMFIVRTIENTMNKLFSQDAKSLKVEMSGAHRYHCILLYYAYGYHFLCMINCLWHRNERGRVMNMWYSS
jgi:hypothetical protein